MPKRSASAAPCSMRTPRGSSSTGPCRISSIPIRRFKADLPLPKVLADQMKPSRQPEFEPPAGYFNPTALNALAATGRTKMAQLAPQLAAIQKQYNVPASIVVAIWGRETGFGKVDMPFDALSAIATQGFMGRRPDEFRNELLVALKILQEGHATRAMMKSSWAGAMGYTQFLPTDFDKYGVDFDGDGKRDIWGTVTDALASAANSLHSQGWDGEQSLGLRGEAAGEIRLHAARAGQGAADLGVD